MDLPISRHVRIGDPIRMPDGSNAYCVAVVGGGGGDSRLMLNAYSDVIDEKENGEVSGASSSWRCESCAIYSSVDYFSPRLRDEFRSSSLREERRSPE